MRSFIHILPIYGLAALCIAPSVIADYHVDNANDTVAYTASGTKFQTFSFATRNLTLDLTNGSVPVDSSKCYNQSYTLAACTVDNKCQVAFPFTGSGISVYVMHAGFQGISASLAIDSGQNVTTTLPPPSPPSYQTPNVPLFNIQSLPSADHTARIYLLDWDNGTTSLYFDYALVNESHVELPSPSSTASLPRPSSMTTDSLGPITATKTFSTSPATVHPPTPPIRKTSGNSNADSSVNLGVVVGGALGGLLGLIAIVTAIILLKKRKAHYATVEAKYRPDPFPAIPTPARDPVVLLSDQKRRMHFVARGASPYQSDDTSSDFHILSAGKRNLNIEARPSITNPFS